VQWYVDLYDRYGVAPTSETEGLAMNSDELSVPRNDGSCGVWLGMYDDRGGRNIVNNRGFGRSARWTYWSMLAPAGGQRKRAWAWPKSTATGAQGCLAPREAAVLALYSRNAGKLPATRCPPQVLANSTGYRQSAGDEAHHIRTTMPDQLLITPPKATALEQVSDTTLTTITAIIDQNLDVTAALNEAQEKLNPLPTE
jgi:hypothetical protein